MVPNGPKPSHSTPSWRRSSGRWRSARQRAACPRQKKARGMPLLAPISVGELLDKISILEIKAEAITDPAKHANVMRELALLEAVRGREVAAPPELAALYAQLKTVHQLLWPIQDEKRGH